MVHFSTARQVVQFYSAVYSQCGKFDNIRVDSIILTIILQITIELNCDGFCYLGHFKRVRQSVSKEIYLLLGEELAFPL